MCLTVEQHQLAELWELVADLLDLCELRLVLTEEHARS